MKMISKRKWMVLGLAVIILAGATIWLVHGILVSSGIWKPDLSHQRQIDLQSIQLYGGVAAFETRYGEIFVSIVDSAGDCHMFWLQHPESSTEETLEILKTAVSKYETEQAGAGYPPQGVGSPDP